MTYPPKAISVTHGSMQAVRYTAENSGACTAENSGLPVSGGGWPQKEMDSRSVTCTSKSTVSLTGDKTLSVFPLADVRHSPPMYALKTLGVPSTDATPTIRGQEASAAAEHTMPASTRTPAAATQRTICTCLYLAEPDVNSVSFGTVFPQTFSVEVRAAAV